MLTILLMSPALAGCDVDASTAAEAIEARNVAAMTAVASGDVEAYADIFTEDAWQVSPGSEPLAGRAAITENWTGMMMLGRWTFDLEPLEIWACGPSAVERGQGSLSFEPGENAPEGMGPFTVSASYVAHWIEDVDGVWRIRSEAAVAPEAPEQ